MKKKLFMSKEEISMQSAITMIRSSKDIRTPLSAIKENALRRRKDFNKTVYDPKIENEFFEDIEVQIYKQIGGKEE